MRFVIIILIIMHDYVTIWSSRWWRGTWLEPY